MARLRNDIQKLVDQLAPSVRKAFLASIADIRSEAQLSVIVGALQRGDTQAVIQALNLKAEFFQPLDDMLRAAYIQGGAAALAGLPAIPDPFPDRAWWRASMVAILVQNAGSRSNPRD